MYTPEEVALLIDEYEKAPNQETIASLASRLQRSPKSIIGKLSREGVYRKQMYLTKTGEAQVTKKEQVATICNLINGDISKLEGLDKAPKQALKYLIASIAAQ